MNHFVRPHRLLVSGGSRLSPKAALLWRELGARLAMEDGLVVITGGLDQRLDTPDRQPADRAVIDGMLDTLRQGHMRSEDRIETFLPDAVEDWNTLRRFREGRIRILQQRTAQARRFSMVYSADVTIAVEGDTATRSILDAAVAIERPVLPVPCGGGASADVWRTVRDEIRDWFRLSDEEVSHLERSRLQDLDEAAVRALATRLHAYVMRGFARSCFVIMPFGDDADPVYDRAIRPALSAHGVVPLRTDRVLAAGDILAAVRNGLRHCQFAIADTTGDRPNVMYELGMAHANGKPVVLLRRTAPDGTLSDVPFDFQSEAIIGYGDDLDDLRRRLETAIAVVRGTIRSLDEHREP